MKQAGYERRPCHCVKSLFVVFNIVEKFRLSRGRTKIDTKMTILPVEVESKKRGKGENKKLFLPKKKGHPSKTVFYVGMGMGKKRWVNFPIVRERQSLGVLVGPSLLRGLILLTQNFSLLSPPRGNEPDFQKKLRRMAPPDSFFSRELLYFSQTDNLSGNQAPPRA